MINKKHILICLLGTTLSLSALEEPIEKQHIPVKSRPSAAIELQAESSDELDAEVFVAEERVANHSMYYTTHPGAYHTIASISIMGDMIELEDGSIWSIYSGDGYAASSMLPGDGAVIVPHNVWLSSYDFEIIDQLTGTSVRANLKLGPFYDSPFAHWIVAINYEENRVYLEDGSEWQMSYFDYGTIRRWLPEDTVIIGVYNGWFNPNMIINVSTLEYAAGSASY